MIPTFNFCWGLKHLALYTVRAFSYSQQLGLVKQPDKGSDLHNIDLLFTTPLVLVFHKALIRLIFGLIKLQLMIVIRHGSSFNI
ncbi:hypothetical protein HMPREF1171_04098 [Aeromonas dhakensis]|uniref:Uncharacterized protein n=1 Tax=Aeromonas dhakensis TaxID=196024 RepID=K1JGW0_9GAMM|nr:hypothetical protein HMPREF1171_04098 [Aeromonas dhakensis]